MSNPGSRLHSVSLVAGLAVCVSVACSTNAVASDWQTDVMNIHLTDDLLRPGGYEPGTVQLAQSDDGPPVSNDDAQAVPDDSGQAGQAAGGDAGQLSTKELSQETTDPTGELALVFTQFGFVVSDGDDLKDGDHKMSGITVFQPIIPIPLYGAGVDEWRIVSRPTIELRVEEAIPEPERDFSFNRQNGLSDLLLPLPVALPRSIAGNWLLALGPDFAFPTATQDELGRQQYSAGVTGIIGYQAENWIAGAYPQFYWGFADQGRDDDVKAARFGNMFYWFWYNITDDMQIGASPTINFDDNAESGNKWNVPVGLGISKMVNIGDTPTRIEAAIEYSAVHEKDFGRQWLFKINLIPVVPRPIPNAIFGGL